MFSKQFKFTVLLFLVALSFSSCGEYQKLLRSEDNEKKLAAADSLYTIGKYKKALGLMEQLVPALRGKPNSDKLMFQYATTFYMLEDYVLSGYQYERFTTSYPKSDSVELAAYRSAESYYKLSPRFSLDQEETSTAMEKLQAFVDSYPSSQYREQANTMVNELKTKLEKKDFEIAKQYLKTAEFMGTYRPAISAFENFIKDHPGSVYRKEAFFLKFKAAYLFAINSVPSLVTERLKESKKHYNSFNKYFGESDLREDAQEIIEDIEKRLLIDNNSEIK